MICRVRHVDNDLDAAGRPRLYQLAAGVAVVSVMAATLVIIVIVCVVPGALSGPTYPNPTTITHHVSVPGNSSSPVSTETNQQWGSANGNFTANQTNQEWRTTADCNVEAASSISGVQQPESTRARNLFDDCNVNTPDPDHVNAGPGTNHPYGDNDNGCRQQQHDSAPDNLTDLDLLSATELAEYLLCVAHDVRDRFAIDTVDTVIDGLRAWFRTHHGRVATQSEAALAIRQVRRICLEAASAFRHRMEMDLHRLLTKTTALMFLRKEAAKKLLAALRARARKWRSKYDWYLNRGGIRHLTPSLLIKLGALNVILSRKKPQP